MLRNFIIILDIILDLRKENFISNSNPIAAGQNLFYLGVFLLPSAFFLSGIFLFISLLISFFQNRKLFLKDKWNFPFIASSFLMVFSSFYNQIFINSSEVDYWIGLLNWIPLFFAFFSFQFYLDSSKKRYIFSILLLSGSFPVFFSCIAQYFFQSYGPYETLNGLIIWYQKPFFTPQNELLSKGVSGLFSNANYTGLWLSMIFPFSLINCFKIKKNLIKKIFLWLLTLLIVYLVILTESRNAFLGLLISIPIIFSIKGFLFLIGGLFLFSIFISINTISFIPKNFNDLLTKFMSDELFLKFKYIFYENIRFEIWSQTFLNIINKPLLGWGAGSFSLVFLSLKGKYFNITHAHNLPLELAYNYGIPLAIVLLTTVLLVLVKSSKIIYSYKKSFDNIINKAWLASTIIVLFAHLSDVTYYDGRISISCWILLAGLKTIIDTDKNLKRIEK